MRKTTVATLTAVGLVSFLATNAHAQAVAGALQVGIGTGLVSYTSPTYTVHNYPVGPGAIVGDLKTNPPITTWGFASRNGVTLEGGYGLNDMFVIGGMLQLGGWSQSSLPGPGNATEKTSMFDLFIAPKLDVMFLPESRVRPFVGGAIGLTHFGTTTERTTPAAGGATVTTTQNSAGATGIGLLGRAGIRWFLTPGFSIDPAFVFSYSAMSGSTEEPRGAATVSYDSSMNSYTIGLNVGFSGWVGL